VSAVEEGKEEAKWVWLTSLGFCCVFGGREEKRSETTETTDRVPFFVSLCESTINLK
jgi:hypothetical protein